MHTQQSFANAIGSGTFPCITRSWLFWFFCPSNHKHALIPLKPWLFCLGEKQKEIIYFTVEIGSFYVNVKSAGEKWTRANFHHHCLVVSLLPTVHINNRNIYFITFLHLFINCPALFPPHHHIKHAEKCKWKQGCFSKKGLDSMMFKKAAKQKSEKDSKHTHP